MSNTNNEAPENRLVEFTVGDSEIKLSKNIVQDYLTNGQQITMPEFKMFSELCKVRQLNPFLKEAYIIKYGSNPAQIVVGKDAILKRAIENKSFDGREQGIIILTQDNKVIHREGTFRLNNELLVGGWAKVYRKDWSHPVYVTVSFDEVAQKKNGGALNHNWATKGATMVEKVALVRALREAFTEDLGGMVDENEVWKDEKTEQDARESVVEVVEKQADSFEEETNENEIDINEI